jgi:hypothetical protein
MNRTADHTTRLVLEKQMAMFQTEEKEVTGHLDILAAVADDLVDPPLSVPLESH